MSRGRRRRWPAAVLAVALSACATTASPSSDDAVAGPRPAPTPAPPDVVVALRDGEVVELDSSDGQVIDRHTVGDAEAVSGLELVGARGAAVVTRSMPDGPDELVEVDLGDGRTRVLGPGHRPAVSDDGMHLAFVRPVEDTDRRELVATTYDGSEEGVWLLEEARGEDLEVLGLSWSPTAEELAVTLDSAAGREVRLLPVDRSGTVRGASEAVPPTSHGAELVAAAFRGHRLTVAEGCCTPGAHERWRVLDVTLGTLTTRELLADPGGPVTHLDWDAKLTHLLLTLDATPALRAWGHDGLEDVAEDGDVGAW